MAGSTSSTSPTSPSAYSFGTTATSSSHYTSEEPPDLGAGFRTVLREWTYLQPPPRIPTYIHHYSPSQDQTSQSRTEDGRRSTVWAYEPIAQYLEDDRETETDTDTTRSVHIETETETEIEPSVSSTASSTASVSLVDDYTLTLRTQPSPPATGSLHLEFDLEQNNTNLDCQHERDCGPSLGYLDQALSFIAAERAQLAARTNLSQPDAWRHVIDPPSTATRRKRRRRKPKPPTLSKLLIEDDNDAGVSYHHAAGSEDSDDDAEGDDEQSPCFHSILKYQSKSTPLTPRPRSPTSPTPPTSALAPSLLLPIKAEPCNVLSSSDSPFTSHSGEPKRPARKRTRAKVRRTPVPSSASLVFPHPSSHTHLLTHARSVPSLRILARYREGVGETSLGLGDSTLGVTDLEGIDGSTKKLIALARYLAKISPSEQEVLAGVERKMVVQALRRLKTRAAGNTAGFRQEREKKNVGGEGSEEEKEEDRDGEDVLDPKGRAPREGDPPVHVFVDHSNILFGLLTYLKRHPQLNTSANFHQTLRNGNTGINNGQGSANDKAKSRSRIILEPTTIAETDKTAVYMKENKEEKESAPRILTRPHTTTITSTSTNRNTTPTMNTTIPISPASTNLISTLKVTSMQTETQAQTHIHTTPIPLPSFATALSRNAISKQSTSAANLDLPYAKYSTGAGTDTTGTDTTPASAVPASPMKTRTRSRSRKVRKAAQAQHAMFRTPAMVDDCERDVVLFGGRRSLRQVNRGRDNHEYESKLGVGGRHGEMNEEADTQTDAEREGEAEEPQVEREGRASSVGPDQSGSGGDACSYYQEQGNGGNDGEDGDEGPDVKTEAHMEKKGTATRISNSSQRQRHLSHTALALILERGRAVSRRVVVTSSPLYQPMDTLERLGYEVRVYIRVPDLGDGMDRAAKKKSHSHRRHLSGGTTSGGDGSGAGSGSPETPSKSALSSLTQQQFAFPASILTSPTTPSTPTTPARVRYREQGVDELLQLKLHQALAATDDVPPGATIVLATGDGNVGQFSEDGFLGEFPFIHHFLWHWGSGLMLIYPPFLPFFPRTRQNGAEAWVAC
ncbi:hypothetical protein C0993_007600 [Termitomyces sp. T159_Od127]|nr:hypothetical protein C0993_007600 [Termitomyces sp. T159_Od127]